MIIEPKEDFVFIDIVIKYDDTIEVVEDQNIKEPRVCEHGRCDRTETNCSEDCWTSRA